jgi:DNA invertase Pin-like site-specific DNA recombinase
VTYKLGYARVSTRDQDPSAQVKALKADGCDEVFVETASGAKADRPRLQELLGRARKGDTIVIWKLDRLARSVLHLQTLAQTLKDRGIELRSLTDSIDTQSASGKLLFAVLGAIAEFERDVMLERTHEGLRKAKASGKKCGRKPTPPEVIALAAAMVLGGMSIRAAAKAVGVSATTLIRSGVKNPDHNGANSYGQNVTEFETRKAA